MRSARAKINPDVLVWARESAGLEIDEAARRARVSSSEKLQEWEDGDTQPTIVQLRNLARVYKRPIAIFYLSARPADFQPMRDFRRLPGLVAGIERPELRFEIRRAHARREIALELYEEVEGPFPEFPVEGSLRDDPDHLGGTLREALGVPLPEQLAWRNPHEALRGWRTACEEAGVLVLQMTDVDPVDANGFSISEHPLPVIAVNRKDFPNRRIFTLLHEFSHIALRTGGLCDLTEQEDRPPEELRTEVFCNQVAAAALVPKDAFLAEPIVAPRRGTTTWTDDEIEMLSRRYSVSREVIVRRLLTFEKTSEAFYLTKRRQYNEEAVARAAENRRRMGDAGGFASPATLAVSSAGNLFTRLVLQGYYKERISAGDLSDFLEVRLKHLPRIEQQVIPQGVTP
jgi:Zn-dependent peptidase ImmA (M78 family)